MKMNPLSLGTIAEVCGGTFMGNENDKNITISSVEHDSRKVTAGALFLCIKGERSDGHDYAEKAFSQGAVCLICEHEMNVSRPYIIVESTTEAIKKIGKHYRSLFSIPVIGVTGSVGKTSAKEMVSSALSAKLSVHKTEANLNNELGVPLTLMGLREEHDVAVIEMGISDFGEMSRLADMVRPDISIMTNIGYCHLEALGDLNGVLKAKSEVYSYMNKDGIAVVNGDDALLSVFDPKIKKLTYGIGAHNDIKAENIVDRASDGIDCDIVTADSRFSVHIPAFGSHMVLAALCAAAVSKSLGLSDAEIAQGLLNYKAVGGRANITDINGIRVINDCYNANPNSVRAALTSLSGLSGKKVAVLGDMFELGKDSDMLHRSIGEFAAEKCIDLLLCCGENSKNMYDGFISAPDHKEGVYFNTRDELIEALSSNIKEGDNILVKASHGMHFEKIVDTLLGNK